jgi:uncharacterized protein (DUF2249 family)
MEFTATVKATDYPPHMKHPVIFQTFDGLKPGECMQLINDHDPRPLRYQFDAERPGLYDWEYLEQGPVTFRVKISRTKA